MVTNDDRLRAELLRHPDLADEFELVPSTLGGIPCAVIAHVAMGEDDDTLEMTVRPVAILVNRDLFFRLSEPAALT